MLADGLTRALSPPLALLALMAGRRYQVPEGRTKGLLRTALIAAQLRRGGGVLVDSLSLGADASTDICRPEAESDMSIWSFSIVLVLIIGLAFIVGCLSNAVASRCLRRRRKPPRLVENPTQAPMKVETSIGEETIKISMKDLPPKWTSSWGGDTSSSEQSSGKEMTERASQTHWTMKYKYKPKLRIQMKLERAEENHLADFVVNPDIGLQSVS